MSELVSIMEPISFPDPSPKHFLVSMPETDCRPTIQNQFRKTSKLAGIDFDENFIRLITSSKSLEQTI